MYHSVTFGTALENPDGLYRGKNTWDDWHLIPSSRPLVAPPSVRTKTQEIPGCNGTLDLTEILTGSPLYENRSGSMEFYVDNGYWPWSTAYSAIMAYLHGKRMKMILEDDPDWYYEGRFAVNQWRSDQSYSLITINYDLKPFKKSVKTYTVEASLAANTGKTLYVEGSVHAVNPMITASRNLTLTLRSDVFALSSGSHIYNNIFIQNGINEFNFLSTASATVSLSYRKEAF